MGNRVDNMVAAYTGWHSAATYFDHNAARGQRRNVSFEVIEWDAPLVVTETRDEDAVRRVREAWEMRIEEGRK